MFGDLVQEFEAFAPLADRGPTREQQGRGEDQQTRVETRPAERADPLNDAHYE